MDDIKPRDKDNQPRRFNKPPFYSGSPSRQPVNQDNLPSRTPINPSRRPEEQRDDLLEDSLQYAAHTKSPASVAKKSFVPPANKKPRRRLPWKITIVILVLLIAGGSIYWFVVKPRLNKPAPATNSQAVEKKEKPKNLTGNFRVLATGDMITHDSVNQNAKKPDGTYDYAPMLAEIKPLLEKAPTRICHNTVPAAGGAISGFPSFNAPKELIAGLASSGCNVFGLASDHINDKGQPAIDATLQAIDAQKSVVVTGGANRSVEEQKKDRFFNVGDGVVKFAYFSFTTRQANNASSPFGVSVYNKDTAKQQLTAARQKADYVLVSMCWGKEDSGDIIPEQEKVAQELSDMGADVVFGHCTHMVQPVKKLKSSDNKRDTIVYYSLGNMLSSQLPVETLIGGIAVVDIDLETKKITSTGFLPTYMHYEWTDDQKNKKDLNARRNLKLYPLDKAEAPLAASQNGTTVVAQTARLKEILNRFTLTTLHTTADFK